MFTYKMTVKMHDTDAAGVIFFGNQFRWVHDAYETVLEAIGFGFADILAKTNFFIPIIHAQADYRVPLTVGDCITIEVRVKKIGKTSFIMRYTLRHPKKGIIGTAQTVHVATHRKTRKKISLPKPFRKALTEIS